MTTVGPCSHWSRQPAWLARASGPRPGLLQLLLEGVAQRLPPVGVAAAPRVAGLADVAADEDVVGERGHGSVPGGSDRDAGDGGRRILSAGVDRSRPSPSVEAGPGGRSEGSGGRRFVVASAAVPAL